MIGLLINKIFTTALSSYKVYPVRAPQGTTSFPFAVYQILSEQKTEEKNSTKQPSRSPDFTYTDVSSMNVTRVQITVVSNTYDTLSTLSKSIEDTFDKLHGTVTVTNTNGSQTEIPVNKINMIDRTDLFDNDGEYQGTQGTYMRAIDFEFRIGFYT